MHVEAKFWAGALFALAALVLTSGSAIADETGGREIRVPTATADTSCPKSISSRYPWIACRVTAMGTKVIAGPNGNATWEGSRVLQGDHPFINQGGYFGAIADPMADPMAVR
jgi:hypothetical protein